MKRLTEKHWRNLDPWECCGQDDFCKRGFHEAGGCNGGCIVPKLYDRLATYEDAEERGLLLRLPCPIGTTVYALENGCGVISIVEMEFEYDMASNIGKGIYLTIEEAEAALAKEG